MVLTNSQLKTVDSLFKEYLEETRKVVDFSAPTGSGKTFMAAHLISRIFQHSWSNENKKTMIIIGTISNSELPKAFKDKLNKYKKYLSFRDFDVFLKQPPSKKLGNHVPSFTLENNKVLVFGTSSFGRNKIFTEMGLLENLYQEMEGWNIVYIRDEAHSGGISGSEAKSGFYKRFDDKMQGIASFTIQMTATPKGAYDLIKLTEEDLLKDEVFLLKNTPIYNEFQQSVESSEQLIKECIKKFKEVQEEYKKLEHYIRPALLIQVDSKKKNITEVEHDTFIANLIRTVSKKEGLSYLKYFSNDKEGNTKEDLTLEAASKNDSNYDVIIFKVGPATGWDIPRACMLLQIREVSSNTLNVQTLGRIKRNPVPGLLFNKITDRYYVYSNYQESSRKMVSYKLKNNFKGLKLYQGRVTIDEKHRKLMEKSYSESVESHLLSSAFKDNVKDNSNKERLSIETRYFKSSKGMQNAYSIYISSIFRLKTWNNQAIKKVEKYFTVNIMKMIDTFSKEMDISREIILYTIIKEYLGEMKIKYMDCYRQSKQHARYKIIKNIDIINNYKTWVSENKDNQLETTDFDKYGYSLIRNLNDSLHKDIQYLDSFPEVCFMEKIMDEMRHEDYHEKMLFFSKMPTLSSEIYFEYISSRDFQKHKSYVDFALVYKDRTLMIEVKGWNDYDLDKTRDLLDAFNKYTLYNKRVNIKLLICYAGKKGKVVTSPVVQFLDNNDQIQSVNVRRLLKDFFKP